MKTFDFDAKELDVLLMSLIQRRNNVKSMVEICTIPEHKNEYVQEMGIVNSLLEKIFPGIVQRLDKAA